MKITVTGISTVKSSLNDELRQLIREVAAETQRVAQAVTPVKTGNARRNWNQRVTDRNFVVENRVPYIERLEAGASKQAPKGIIGPTLTQVKGKFK